jgi:hypothetical protein
MLIGLVNVSFGIDELLNNSNVTWTLIWPDSQVTEREGRVLICEDSDDCIWFYEALSSRISAIDCSEPLAYDLLEQTLCQRHNETVEGWVLTFRLVDGDEVVTLSTNLSFTIWNPPPPAYVEPEVEQPSDDGADGDGQGVEEFGIGGITVPTDIVIGLVAVLVMSILLLLVTTKKKPPKRPMRPKTPTLYRR